MSRPNILVLMTDQQHHSTIGQGSPCKTPNLDRIIESGVIFNNAFTPSPICTPARTSFQTGLLPHQHRMMHNVHKGKNYHIVDDMPEGIKTLGDVMRKEGYETAYIGKWDSGLCKTPLDYGYEQYIMTPKDKSHKEYMEVIKINGEEEEKRAVIAAITKDDIECTEVFKVARQTCICIEELAGRESPFYIYATCTEPHVPWICPSKYAEKYDFEAINLSESYEDDFSDKPGSYMRHYNKQNYCHLPEDRIKMKKALKAYYGVIALIDDAFGLILNSLETAGCLENTLIIFTSDHGELMGAHGLIGKEENLLDDTIRIPLVISYPDKIKPGSCDSFVTLTDLFSTIAEFGGSDMEKPSTSRSLVPLLLGKKPEEFPDLVFSEHNGSSFFNTVRGVRTKDYKYVFRPHETDEFYDLRNDPHEIENKIDDKNYRNIIIALQEALVKWMKDTGDQAAKGAQYVLFDRVKKNYRTYEGEE